MQIVKLPDPLKQAQKRKFMRLSYALWQGSPEEMNEEYPEISVVQFKQANKFFDSKRCEGCSCGSCIDLPSIASNLDDVPKELIPIAKLAQRLGAEELAKSK